MKFEDLNIIRPILKALAEQGYTRPTPIQEQALPPALEGRDVLGCAQTGTGKTCAFAVPILQRLQARPQKGHPIRALVLTPTRELAIQIQECFLAYGKNLPLRSTVIFGGVGQSPQVEALHKGTDILVATPGRLQDLHNQGEIDVTHLEVLVLDEADRMLDMGFIHDVKRILEWLPRKKQTLFFSATMPRELTGLVNSLLHNPVRVAVDPISSPVERIEQRLYYVDRGNKTALLADLLREEQVAAALVFTRTKHGANKVAQDLKKRGINAEAIHGNKSQTARQNALNGFKEGTVRVLVATDLAARGLDIEELPYVFNYNLPDVPETYVHRIGRTGRAGREGVAISFCDITEKDMLRDIEKLIGRPVPVTEGHPYPMVVLEPPKKDKHGRIINQEDQEARQAAREKHQQRTRAAAPPVEEPPAVPEQEEPAGKKKKSGKKSAQKQTVAPEEKPAAKAVGKAQVKQEAKPQVSQEEEESFLPSSLSSRRERTYTRPVRQTSLEDFLKEITGGEEETDYSEFAELEAKLEQRQNRRFLDATDRLFATHSSRYRDTAPRREAPPPPVAEKASTGKKKKPATPKVEEQQAAPEKKGRNGKAAKQTPAKEPEVTAAPKGKKPAKAAPARQTVEEKAPPAAPKKRGKKKGTPEATATVQPETGTQEGRLLQVKAKKKGRGPKTPPPMERSPYATQKDSTEQKSLMKPYYIDKK